MKPTKMPARAILLLVVAQLTVPIFLSPALIPPTAGFAVERLWGASASVVNLVLSAVLAALAALAYAPSRAHRPAPASTRDDNSADCVG